MTESEAVEKVRWTLNYRVTNQCYSASEAVYHLLGGLNSGYTPMQMWYGAVSHWYLRAPDGRYVDPTADQFDEMLDYSSGVGRGFQTKQPSRAAKEILDAIKIGLIL